MKIPETISGTMGIPVRAARGLGRLPGRALRLLGRRPQIGAPPGALGDTSGHQESLVRIISYNSETIEVRNCHSVEEVTTIASDTERRHWIDIQGLRDVQFIQAVTRAFAIHDLALADAINVPQRPKFEPYEGHLFFIGKMFRVVEGGYTISEQISLFLKSNVLITVQETHGDVFDPVRARLRDSQFQIRHSSVAYLTYALIDTMIDAVYPVIDIMGDQLEATENHITDNPIPEDFTRLHGVKRELLHLSRALRPQREAVNALLRSESPIVDEKARFYLRDTYDHAVHSLETVEAYRDLTGELTDLYLSVVSNRMNEIMKVLTMISTIFIPLSFLAGIYGMNFHYMPELDQHWGYPALLGIMAAIAAGMIFYFRKKGWLGVRSARKRRLETEINQQKPQEGGAKS